MTSCCSINRNERRTFRSRRGLMKRSTRTTAWGVVRRGKERRGRRYGKEEEEGKKGRKKRRRRRRRTIIISPLAFQFNSEKSSTKRESNSKKTFSELYSLTRSNVAAYRSEWKEITFLKSSCKGKLSALSGRGKRVFFEGRRSPYPIKVTKERMKSPTSTIAENSFLLMSQWNFCRSS